MANPFVKATKEDTYLRMAIMGPSGSGKTWTALLIAEQLAKLRGGRIALLDTEGGSARKYAGHFDFDVYELGSKYPRRFEGAYDPNRYIELINAAAQYEYAVIVVDSLSQAWNGAGGILDIVDNAGQKMGNNKWAGWSKGRPAQNALVDALINAEIDIIGTMRAKTDWVLETDDKGKQKPVKKGLAPVQSSDFEYEFDVVIQLDMQHTMSISKTRCSELVTEGEYRDTTMVANTIYNWLSVDTPEDVKTDEEPEEQPDNVVPLEQPMETVGVDTVITDVDELNGGKKYWLVGDVKLNSREVFKQLGFGDAIYGALANEGSHKLVDMAGNAVRVQALYETDASGNTIPISIKRLDTGVVIVMQQAS